MSKRQVSREQFGKGLYIVFLDFLFVQADAD